MSKILFGVLLCVLLFSFGEGFIEGRRNAFWMKFRGCKTICSGEERRNNGVQTCLVLLEHNNITVTPCVVRCLKRKRENLTNVVECQCKNSKCLPSTPTSGTASSVGSSSPITSQATPSTGSSSPITSPATPSAGSSSSITSPTTPSADSSSPITSPTATDSSVSTT